MTHSELVTLYGSEVEPGEGVVEWEYPDGSGSWGRCAPGETLQIADRFVREGCHVWINGESVLGLSVA